MGVSKEETRAAANQMSEYESEDDSAQEIDKKAPAELPEAEPTQTEEEETMQAIED